MKLAIMQPYFFPYIGYWQLIKAVDAFVVYDDVNYIMRGYINRNSILIQGKPQQVTLELTAASQNKFINEISLGDNRNKLLRTIQMAYGKALFFKSVFPLIEEILTYQESNLSIFLNNSLQKIAGYLGMHPKWYLSSKLNKNNTLKGQEKILAICEELEATHYINVPGGKSLYNPNDFEKHGVQLSFIQPRAIEYKQFNNIFIPNLSIIDVMMFNSREQCIKLIEEYDLV